MTEVSCDDFMNKHHIAKKVETNIGDSFTVILCSNPSTGFQWTETAQISDQTTLKQIDYIFVSPQSDPPPPPGTPGQEIWTFEALKESTATISMEYSRPWEGGEKREWTLDNHRIYKSMGAYCSYTLCLLLFPFIMDQHTSPCTCSGDK